ncbi:23S rRNA (adenine(2503)-C(2))-methyltransferase RlmN [Treponema sp. R6D11]
MGAIPASLAGLLPAEIETLLLPLPRFRAVQIYKWITRGVSDFDQMTDLPSSLREELKNRFRLYSSAVSTRHEDAQGGSAAKFTIALEDGLKIEAVLLQDGKSRFTACLSTQAGCPAACVFCKTGSLGFSRNLTAAEIAEQFLFLRNTLPEGDSKEADGKSAHAIENIVIMGMGEPLLNLPELRKALAFFTDGAGLNFSKRRITVSTCGICEGLFDLAENGPYTRLALSLVTADEELRGRLMPIAAANPLEKVKQALIAYQDKSGARITLELPLLGGVNTRDKDALEMARFAKGLDSVINLIPWNPADGLEFEGKPLREPDKKETEDFVKLLEGKGLKVTMRRRKGRGVMGACGQLGVIYLRNQENTA